MLIAEIGLAHMGRIDYAKRLIDEARGADAIKFQVYKTQDLIDRERDPERFKRFQEREISYEGLFKLKKYTEQQGYQFLATPHTVEAFHFLKDLGVEAYKIGSGDRDEILPLALDTGKKVYVSTGMRSHKDILRMVQLYGNENVTFLHCITRYPVLEGLANLNFISTLGRWAGRVGAKVGYSDHLPGTIGCELAIALGAEVVEKHVKLPQSKGQDTLCALDGKEFRTMCKKLKRIKTILGSKQRIYSAEEKQNESWALKGPDGKRPLS